MRQKYFRKKITILEKENQCLKNKVKNQHFVVEILITRDKCGNKWEVVKNNKIKTNTNKISASSLPSKISTPAQLQNRLSRT